MDIPFRVGEQVEHILTFEGVDCFTEPTESVGHAVSNTTKAVSIRVKFPQNFLIKSFRAFKIYNNQSIDLSDQVQKRGMNDYEFSISHPLVGTMLVFEWDRSP